MNQRPADWPGAGPIDLAVQDLPHESSTLEWWYLNSHLETEDGRPFSVFASFFRMVVGKDKRGAPIHSHSVTWALVDVQRHRYVMDPVLDRCAPDVTLERLNRGEGTRDERLRRAMAEVLQRKTVPRPDRLFDVNPVVDPSVMDLRFGTCRLHKTPEGSYALDLLHEDGKHGARLVFTPEKPMVRHGDEGQVVGASAEDMFYYFTPRCRVEGSVLVEGATLPVTKGMGWYDHEFGRPADERKEARRIGSVAWNWLSAQLDNGYDISAYDLFDVEGGGRSIGHWLIVVDPQGNRSQHSEFSLTEGTRWTSTRTFNDYPVRYHLAVPGLQLDVDVSAEFNAQEFPTLISPPAFWEGRMRLKGTMGGRSVGGLGFVERSGFNNVETQDRFFEAVGRATRQAVDQLLPPTADSPQLARLVSDPGHEHFTEGMDLAQYHRHVVTPVREIVTRGGKAWRSYALLAAMDVVGGDSQQYAHWLAVPEILHTGSLIIDDVQDRSVVRRGGASCHKVHGEPLAINAGSACMFLAQLPLLREKLPDRVVLRIYESYFEALRAAHAGQAMDISGQWHRLPSVVESGDATSLEASVLATHRLKSGVPPANLARIAALMAGANDAQVEALGRLFEAYGTAFQIIDDVLNLRGFQGGLKTRGEDITEGKITAPVAKAMGKLERPARHQLWEILQSRPTATTTIGQAIRLMEDCGALKACEEQARTMVEEAWAALDPLVVESTTKIYLRAFGWYLLERHY
ncbi:MAG: polyprenyl synthetase family protein [Myxococcota bacterium]